MKRITLLASLLLLSRAAFSQTFDLQRIWASGDFYPKGIYGIHMLPDGDFYTKDDYVFRSSSAVILKYSFEKPLPVDTLFNSANVKDLRNGFNLEDYSISGNGQYILLQTNSNAIYRHSREAQYYIYNVKDKTVKPVNKGERVFYASFSPANDRVAFVYGNNIYTQKIDDNSIRQVTTDGAVNKIINGKSDWVYEEEFALVRSYEWSPRGDKIAFYRFDESKVKEYELPNYDSAYPSHYHYKYPIAGEDNSQVGIYIYNVADGKTLEIPVGKENDQYIPRIKWTNDNNILSIERLNRLQNHLELLFANSSTGQLNKVYDETSDTYLEITDNLYFLKDNSFILTSDQNGYNQVFLIKGQDKQLLTAGKYDVDAVLAVDEAKGRVYFKAFDPTPLDETVYSVKLNGNDKKPLVANQKGRNSAEFSAQNTYFIFTSSTPQEPTQVLIYRYNGKKVRTLEDNQELKDRLAKFNLPQKEFFKIPLNDTLSLNAWMIKPPHFSEGTKYPVLLTVYGGPGYQTVKNEWGSMNDIWFAYLATKGIIVVSVDNRGTGARGAAFRKVTYKKLGILESDDFISSAKWMAQQPYVDGKRIGIFGWSFGGYMSLMSLMRGSDVFKMGVAVAPVTDWHFYDNIYTERYMQRPQDNPEGYDETSVFKYVPQLKGDLLLIHGTYDDNVHPQNSFMLISEMIKQGKTYDSEFYPNKNHSIFGGNTRLMLFTRITDYILQKL